MNILTFDIEEWYLEKAYFGAKESKYADYDRLLDEILVRLSDKGIKGTFFCVGKMASEFPHVVRKIADVGHEVGCHSNIHQWLNKMSYADALEDTRAAVDSLQQCIGKKVVSFRAPAFSIGSGNKWAFEALANNGITCDASVFPASRDFGGFPGFSKMEPTIVRYNGIELHEFPIVTTKILGKDFAYSGGGYFRFFPYGFIEREMQKTKYSMTYFHLGDLLPVISGVMPKDEYERYFNEPGTVKARYLRYVKTNLGVRSNKKKLFRLIDGLDFNNISEADQQIDWSLAPVLSL
ncbi:MAG: Polysaccharide deactylase, PEP-CTERM locus subfamily [bacterium P3]|nr:MAG: Polysaccharide deactylase, PEP-CTERM locus subfamily [bacterium P3]KWW42483.1 MAG: Polysaccharide deactylase, PEP-CTERM locus subfamily [bacterium F083]